MDHKSELRAPDAVPLLCIQALTVPLSFTFGGQP